MGRKRWLVELAHVCVLYAALIISFDMLVGVTSMCMLILALILLM
jgi:hypothetical protein